MVGYLEGEAVISIDRKKKTVTLADGRSIRYSKLVLADPWAGFGCRVRWCNPSSWMDPESCEKLDPVGFRDINRNKNPENGGFGSMWVPFPTGLFFHTYQFFRRCTPDKYIMSTAD